MLGNIIKYILPYGIVFNWKERKRIITEPNPLELLNARGNRVNVFYFQDDRCSHTPYSLVSGRIPHTILWDRYNCALPIQFYTHMNIFRRSKYDSKQFGLLIESEQICPSEYAKVRIEGAIVNSLNALFTHSEKLLDKYPNAKFIPGGGCWYGTKKHGGIITPQSYLRKNNLISIVSSTKTQCALHQFRLDLAKEMLRQNVGDVMGTVVNRYVNVADSLTDYMYSVAIENCSSRYYFTEKILNCFASMTIPIYYGAHDIGTFFNPDGIIFIKEPTVEYAMKALQECSKQDYCSRKEAILDNYQRVQKYLSIEDYIVDNYSSLF